MGYRLVLVRGLKKQQYHHHRPLYFFLSLCGPYPNRRVQLRNYGDGMDGSAQRENETGVVIFARQSATLVCVLISSSARPLIYNPLSLLRFLSKEVPNCREHPQVKDRLETVTTSKCTRCCVLFGQRAAALVLLASLFASFSPYVPTSQWITCF